MACTTLFVIMPLGVIIFSSTYILCFMNKMRKLKGIADEIKRESVSDQEVSRHFKCHLQDFFVVPIFHILVAPFLGAARSSNSQRI